MNDKLRLFFGKSKTESDDKGFFYTSWPGDEDKSVSDFETMGPKIEVDITRNDAIAILPILKELDLFTDGEISEIIHAVAFAVWERAKVELEEK